MSVDSPTPGSLEIADLSGAIERDPDAPINYLLRGEAWLICGEPDRAQTDFETARTMATDLLRRSEWGYIYQAYLDRADAGLRRCHV